MTPMQLPADTSRSTPNNQRRHAAAYGRTAVGFGVDGSAPRFGDVGVRAQWTACQDAARSDGYHIPESSDFLFGDDGVSGRASRRPQMERLLDVVRSGYARFSRLYVKDVTRLSRDEDGFSFLKRFENELASHGIELCFLARKDAFVDMSSFHRALVGTIDRTIER